MKLSFRQGLISYQQSGAQPLFLLAGSLSGHVSLSVTPQPTVLTIAHGSSDYLFKFDQTVQNAWALQPNVDNWLFLDVNLISGALTFGTTTLEPITSLLQPENAGGGQLWFDLGRMVMRTFNGAKWVDTPRLVVAKVPGGSTTQIQSYTKGSSVGAQIPSSPGFLMLDSQLRPLRTQAGELLTTDTPVRIKTTVGTSGVLSEPVNNFVPVRANEAIPAMSLVYFSGEDSVSLASSDPSLVNLKTPVGIVQTALARNEVGTITQQGEVTYDQWNWGPEEFGKPLYSGFNGQLTLTRPRSIQVFRIGYVKNSKTILFGIDSETQIQVLSAPGSIISGTPPIQVSTSPNAFNEIVSSVSMDAASETADGYMTSEQVLQLQGFNDSLLASEAALEAKANVIHTHVLSDVTGLEASLIGLSTAIDSRVPKFTGTVGNFPAIAVGSTLLDSGYSYESFSLSEHVHTIADVTNLQTTLNSKANVLHTHEIPDILNLQTELESRAFVNHTHVMSDVSGLIPALTSKANVLHTHEIPDILNLQTTLNSKANVIHAHEIDDVTNLQAELDSKAAISHAHEIDDVTNLQAELDSKASISHTHSSTQITDFEKAVEERVSTVIEAGSNISLQYLDDVGKLIISSTPSAAPAAGNNKQIQYNNNGAVDGSLNFTWDNDTSSIVLGDLASVVAVSVRAGISTSGAARQLNISGASASGTSTGGAMSFTSGDGEGNAGGNGGRLDIETGQGAISGPLSISSGSGRTSSGSVLITSGSSTQSGTPGLVTIRGGNQAANSSLDGGSVLVQGGEGGSTNGATNGGHVTIAAARGNNGGTGGNLNLNAGSAGGDVVLRTGTSTLAERVRFKASGELQLNGTSSLAGHVITSSGADEAPAWAKPIMKPAPLKVIDNASTAAVLGSAAHHNTCHRMSSASPITITIPLDSSWTGSDEYWQNSGEPLNPGEMPIGGSILISRTGTGSVTIAAVPGVTLNSPSSLSIAKQHGKITLIKVNANEWDIEGNLT